MGLTRFHMDFCDCFGAFKPILTGFGFFRFLCTCVGPPKVLEYSSKFCQICQILGKIWKCQRHFTIFTSIQKGLGKGGVQESGKIKIDQNVFKQPKTIIESRFGTPPVRIGPYRLRTATPSGGPSDPLRGPLRGPWQKILPGGGAQAPHMGPLRRGAQCVISGQYLSQFWPFIG